MLKSRRKTNQFRGENSDETMLLLAFEPATLYMLDIHPLCYFGTRTKKSFKSY